MSLTQNFLDTFNRADGIPGKGWAQASNKWALAGGQLHPNNVGLNDYIYRPSSEIAMDQEVTVDFTPGDYLFALLRCQSAADSPNFAAYAIGGGMESETKVYLVDAGGNYPGQGGVPSAFPSNHQGRLVASAIGHSPTTITWTIYDLTVDPTASTPVASLSFTDNTAALQVAGTQGLAGYNRNANVQRFNVRSDAVIPSATAYTLTGPSVAAVGSASAPFTVTPNANFTGTITPSDGAGGTFTPSSLTYSDEATALTFTYSPATTGTHSVSVTDSGTLTDPAPISVLVAAAATVIPAVSSSVVHSGQWVTKNGNKLQAWNPHAYLRVYFTGGDVCLINLDQASVPETIIACYRVDGGAWSGKVNIAPSDTKFVVPGIVGRGDHVVEIAIVETSATCGWFGAQHLRVVSFDVSGGTALPKVERPGRIVWAGDSIIDGINAGASDSNNALNTYFAIGAEHFKARGYESEIFSRQSWGWTVQANGNLPAFIIPSAPTTDSWDMIESTVPRYAAGVWANGEPDAFITEFGTNCDAYSVPDATVRTAVDAWISAMLAATTKTKVILTSPVGRGKANVLAAAVTAANSPRVLFVDMGSFPGYPLHPSMAQHANIASILIPLLDPILPVVDVDPPSIPVLNTVTPGNAQITPSWSASTGSPTSYDYRLNAGSPVTVGNVLTTVITGLTNGNAYNVQVRARDAAGNFSDWSNAISATPAAPDTTPPSIPVLTTLTPGDGTLLVAWNASTGGAVDYQYRVNGGSAVSVGNTLSHEIDGLTNGTEYTVEVRALDNASPPNASGWSNALTGTPTAGSDIPAGFARITGDLGFQTSPTSGAQVTASIRGNGPCFIDGELQNPNGVAPATTASDGTWHLDLLPIPLPHFWEVSAAGQRIKLLPTLEAGQTYELEAVVDLSGYTGP